MNNELHARSESQSEYFKQYYQDNKEDILERVRTTQKNRYDNDLEHKLIKRYQSRVNNFFPEEHRNINAEGTLGCSSNFFKMWITYCLKGNLNLDNIDLHHVRPLNTFPFETDDLMNAFHWTNVRPILHEINIQQKDKRDYADEHKQKDRVIKFLRTIYLK